MDKQITSAEDYVKLVSTQVELPSGATFHVRAPNPYEVAELLKLMPEEDTPPDNRTFMKKYLPALWKPVVYPCIMEPIVPETVVPCDDALILLETVINLSGILRGGGDENGEDDDPFPDTGPSADA